MASDVKAKATAATNEPTATVYSILRVFIDSKEFKVAATSDGDGNHKSFYGIQLMKSGLIFLPDGVQSYVTPFKVN